MDKEEAIAAVMDELEAEGWLEDATEATYKAEWVPEKVGYRVETNHPEFEDIAYFEVTMFRFPDGSTEGPVVKLIEWEDD